MIELLWDSSVLGTARTSFGTLAVGDSDGHHPRELLETAVAGSMMQALLDAASAAGIQILGYVSCARFDEQPTGIPCVRFYGSVVGPGAVSETELRRVTDDARRLSPVARLLGDRLEVEWNLQALVGAEDK